MADLGADGFSGQRRSVQFVSSGGQLGDLGAVRHRPEEAGRFVEFTCGEAVVEYRCEVVEGTFGAEEGRERCRGVGGIVGQIPGHDATQVGDDAGLVLGHPRVPASPCR